jgi:GGDEF domain-containing protein
MKSHDGVKDVFTHLATPSFLYEELRRELARASRNGVPISGIKIVLKHPLKHSDPQFRAYAEIWEREILVLAQTLHSETRGEDICARMGDAEFLILLIGYKGSPEIFIERFLVHLKNERDRDMKLALIPHLEYRFSFRTSLSHDSSLEFLNQLDLATPHLI